MTSGEGEKKCDKTESGSVGNVGVVGVLSSTVRETSSSASGDNATTTGTFAVAPMSQQGIDEPNDKTKVDTSTTTTTTTTTTTATVAGSLSLEADGSRSHSVSAVVGSVGSAGPSCGGPLDGSVSVGRKRKGLLSEDIENGNVVSAKSGGTTHQDQHHPEDRRDGVDLCGNNNRPKKAKKVKTKHMDQRVLRLRRDIQHCCSTNDIVKAMDAYNRAKKEGLTVETQTLYILLNLCGGIGTERGIHIGTPKPTNATAAPSNDAAMTQVDETVSQRLGNGMTDIEGRPIAKPSPSPCSMEQRIEFAFIVKEDMEQRKLALKETSYSSLIRLLSKLNRLEEAQQLLEKAETVQQCKVKLRLYSSLLKAYCDNGRLSEALSLWQSLSKRGLELSEREYGPLLRASAHARQRDFRVFTRVLTDVSEDVLVPAKGTVQSILHWFSSAECDENPSVVPPTSRTPLELPPSLSDTTPILKSWHQDVSEWIIDKSCGISKEGYITSGCLRGERLQPVPLSDKAWNQLMNWNESLVLDGAVDGSRLQYQGGGKGPKRKLDNRNRSRWNDFQMFLEGLRRKRPEGSQLRNQNHDTRGDGESKTRKDDEFVVLDGANIGYFKCNFDSAPKHVDYHKIDWVVKHFQGQGKRVLVVLHERHFGRRLMPDWARPIVDKWDEQKLLYRTPFGMNDDWFWMHAALWFGRKTLVITNDEMRDHHFQMLAPRSFARWKERHQVHFGIDGAQTKNEHRGSDVSKPLLLTYPAAYSRRIQPLVDGLVIPLPMQGDEHRYLDGVHVADSNEPVEETYICIRPRKDRSDTGRKDQAETTGVAPTTSTTAPLSSFDNSNLPSCMERY